MQDHEITDLTGSNSDMRPYVIFTLEEDIFGIDVMKAQEVVEVASINRVPETLPYMKGVYDLRGEIVPIVDMRIKFGFAEKKRDGDLMVIVMIEVHGILVGFIVDAVLDVQDISRSEIQDTVHFSAKRGMDSVQGIGKIDGHLVIMLDVDKVLSVEDMPGISRAVMTDL